MEQTKYVKKSAFENVSSIETDEMYAYADEYIQFLNNAKTEYTCINEIKKELTQAGFVDLSDINTLKPSDKVYYINKDRAIYVAIIGEKMLNSGINIIGSHVDSPRLDTKPMPLYEQENLAMLKTQYYGGIRRYQWLAQPLSLIGVVYLSDGKKIEISIGEEQDDVHFTIPDLLPHLSKEQEEKKASEFVDAESLNVVIGSIPTSKTGDKRIKDKVLEILYKKYGIIELDLARADLRFVPSFKAGYIGLDKGLVAGYGQDDRVCVFATVSSMINIAKEGKTPANTAVAVLVDKEEIGSQGNTSMSSETFTYFMEQLIEKCDSNLSVTHILNQSKMLSADVSASVDPNYASLYDIQNGNIIGCGISIEKYTGSGGKYMASEASAKYMSYCMSLFDKAKIAYQIGTLSKIGKGGGGTIAHILANKGIDVLDCGPSLLGMHSPYELSSVADIYMAYKAYKAFFLA